MRRLAHYSDIICAAIEAVYIAGVVTPWVWRGWHGIAFAVAWGALYSIGISLQVRHEARLCERCLAAMPLDAHVQAERRQRSLRLFHRLTSKPARMVTVGLCWMAVPLPYPWVVLPLTVAALLCLTRWALSWRHRPLQLVCPWCWWGGGGGEDETAPEPTPAPAASAR